MLPCRVISPSRMALLKMAPACVREGAPGTSTDMQCIPAGTSVVIINQPAHRAMEEAAAYQALLRARAQEEAARTQRYEPEPKLHANPDASDPSVLLKNSKDHDYILRNFHTMYVDARDAHYFGSDQLRQRSAITRILQS